MKLVRFLHNQKCRYGMIENDVIYPLAGGLLDKPIRQGLRYALKDVRLLCPVVPTKAICIGLNYRDHAKKCRYKRRKNRFFL